MPNQPLRILCFGAGAIGTYICGSLALDGRQVVFLEKPDIAQDLRQRGLRLELLDRTSTVAAPQVASSLAEALALGPFDAAVFALKSFDTRPALELLKPHLAQIPPVLCLQNGVENEPLLAEVLGIERVIAGTVTSAIARHAAGDITLERRRGVGIADGHPLSARLVEAMSRAGLQARLYPRSADMKWSKMLTNLLANATSAILDMTPAQIFAHAGLFRLEMLQLREALRVMKALGIQPVDLPATPVRLLAFSVQALPVVISRPLLKRAVGRGRGEKMPSFHIDLHSGRKQSEADYLNGAVVRIGETCGVPTPVNRMLNKILLGLTSGEIPLSFYARQPEKLLAQQHQG